jgi:hypothetical protein
MLITSSGNILENCHEFGHCVAGSRGRDLMFPMFIKIATEWILTVPFCQTVVDFDPNLTLAIRRIPAKILCMQLNEPS